MLGLPGWLLGGKLGIAVALLLSGTSSGSWRGSNQARTLHEVTVSQGLQMPPWTGLALVRAAAD